MNQKVIVIILFVLFSLFGIIGYLISTNMDISKTGAYGAKIRFAKNEIIKFPDFELVYLGERKEYVPAYKGGIISFVITTSVFILPIPSLAGRVERAI